jgi:hypothetical protein
MQNLDGTTVEPVSTARAAKPDQRVALVMLALP